MGAQRKNPPYDAAKTIKHLASKGHELLGIAEAFNVHVELLNQWLEDEPKLSYAYEVGREIERQELHSIVFQAAKANLPANNNARFLLRSKHGYKDEEKASNTINVGIATNVMMVRDHGSDEEWAAKAEAQQRELTLNAASPPKQIEATVAPPAVSAPSRGTYEPSTVPASQLAPTSPHYSDAPVWRNNA